MPGLFSDTAPLLSGDAKNAAAPAPAAVPPAVPGAPEKPPAVPFDPKAGAQKLASLFSQPLDPDTGLVKEKKAEEPAAPAVPPKKEDKPIKVVKAKAPEPEKRPTPPKAEVRKPEPAPAAPAKEAVAAAPEEDDATFEKGLAEEEQVLLESARDAGRLMPDKYKDQGGRMAKFLREAVKKEKDIESGDMTEAKYREWYEANRPKIGALDKTRIDRMRATEDAKKEFEPRMEEERHSRWTETERPKVATRAAEARANIWAGALPDSVTAAVSDRLKGVQDPKERENILGDARKEFALELEIATNITDAAREDIEEFYSLTTRNSSTGKALKSLRPEAEVFDASRGEYVPNMNHPDPEVQRQARVIAMISDVCENFKNTGGVDVLKKDGKWFATRAEYAGMSPEQRAGWWTFSDDEIVKRAQSRVKGAVAATIEQHVKQLEARGFKRSGAAAAPVAEPVKAPPAGAPPAPRIAPPPSANTAILTPAQIQARSLAGKLESQPTE